MGNVNAAINILGGILIGFLGVYIMMKSELKDGFSWRGFGQLAVIGAAISYGLAGIFGKRLKNSFKFRQKVTYHIDI